MRLAAWLPALALAGCAGLRAPDHVHPSWEPLFGTYEFTGTLQGQGPVTVLGSVTVGPAGYQLSSSHGSCWGYLERPVTVPGLRLNCKGITFQVRQVEGQLAEQATATVTVGEFQQRQECRTNANGQRVCTTVETLVDVRREARVEVRRTAPPP